MARMSKESQERIVRGAEEVVGLVDEGYSPNEALAKIAKEGDYPPGHVRLMAQAYNTGRTNHQRKEAKDVFAKTASFPLADAEVVLKELYPESFSSVKTAARLTAVSADYLSPPDLAVRPHLEKMASLVEKPPEPYARDTTRLAKRAFSLLRDLEKEKENKRGLLSETHDKLAASLGRLDDYFRTPGGLSFPEVYSNSVLLLGKAAGFVLDKVAKTNPFLKSAVSPRVSGISDLQADPYKAVLECVGLASRYNELVLDATEFEKKAAETAEKLLSSLVPARQPEPEPTTGSILGGSRKQALFDTMSNVAPAVLAADTTRSIMGKLKPEDTAELRSDAYEALTDPGHEARLRKIRTQAVLHSLLANDEFISAEPPERVTDLFNKITQLAPRSAEQPILAQALLRRYLAQGQVDPHDLDQLVGIETKLKQRDQPESNLPNIPGVPVGPSKGTPAKPPEAKP